jgi:RimJ/RimL family protein N-acetyltransferase/GNAT superfamily N-acetyltransferase
VTLPSEPDPATGQPVGLPVDVSPAEQPGPVLLEGQFGRVEKLDPERHGPDLWRAVDGHDALWTYMGYGPFAGEAAFATWLQGRAQLDDPYSYAIVDRQTDCSVGIATLMEIRPAMRVIEVGHIVYSPALQRTPLATEAQYLLARYVFETLGYRRYEWKCNALNAASRRAAERFGFTFEGFFRAHMIVKGRSRDTAWFSILDAEWPMRKAAYERWLAPENFGVDGQQRVSLSILNQLSAEEGGAHIRRASLADLAAIASLKTAAYLPNETFIQRPSLPRTADYDAILRKDEVWAIEGAEGLDGAIVLKTDADAELFSVAVTPSAQARGLGDKLMNFAERRAKALGFPVLKLYTNEKLIRQIDWYRRRGYQQTHVEDHGDRKLVHMTKTLA